MKWKHYGTMKNDRSVANVVVNDTPVPILRKEIPIRNMGVMHCEYHKRNNTSMHPKDINSKNKNINNENKEIKHEHSKENKENVGPPASTNKKEKGNERNENANSKLDENFIKMQIKDENQLSDDDAEENNHIKHEESVKPVLKLNIPVSEKISEVESQLSKLEINESKAVNNIKQSKDVKSEEELTERKPMRYHGERLSYTPYAVSSQVLQSGGGIVLETPAPQNVSYEPYPTHNITYSIATGSGEGNDNLGLSPQSEYPFNQVAAASPPEYSSLDSLFSDLPELQELFGADIFRGLVPTTNTSESTYIPTTIQDVASPATIQDVASPTHQTSYGNEIRLTDCEIYRETYDSSSPSSISENSPLSTSEISPANSPSASPGRSDLDCEDILKLLGPSTIYDTNINTNTNISQQSCPLLTNINTVSSCQGSNLQVCQLTQPSSNMPYQETTMPSTVNISNIIIETQIPQLLQSVQNTQQNAQIDQIQCVQESLCYPQSTQGSRVQQTQKTIQCVVVPDLVLVPGRERLQAKLNRTERDIALVTISNLSDEQLTKSDSQGDTQLMILLVNHNHPKTLEYLYAMVNRLKKIPGALQVRNNQQQSALLLACMFMNKQPVVARFIAEALLEQGAPVNEVYKKGNTLLHHLCAWGDEYLGVLVELLSMRDAQGRPCFDINQHNHLEGAPLHVAVKKHSKALNCSATISFLLKNGANLLEKERCSGQTALHIAVKESCDPHLVQILLQEAERKGINLVNLEDYPGDMALHHAALRNQILLAQQVKVIQLLMNYGAVSNRVGSQGRMPLALVSAERKCHIQRIIRKR